MGEAGFEPAQAEPTVLQTVPVWAACMPRLCVDPSSALKTSRIHVSHVPSVDASSDYVHVRLRHDVPKYRVFGVVRRVALVRSAFLPPASPFAVYSKQPSSSCVNKIPRTM